MMKQEKNRKPEESWGPVQYEERHHWVDKFDGAVSDTTSTGSQPSNPDDRSKRSAI
ncbi:hypothetical protein [Candidatus Nitrosotalea sp. TS]|uniref:hypothetical protein n=1 Tax=Candidatus Nitrosotalea sp. TS TaxID=2341020 RepID=UPI0014076FCF|nr:hypothetical protein [Candidatus Nitrosotalea sp. TS]